jgi:hypothetical protein
VKDQAPYEQRRHVQKEANHPPYKCGRLKEEDQDDQVSLERGKSGSLLPETHDEFGECEKE